MLKNEVYWKTVYSDDVTFDQPLPGTTFDVAIVGAGIIGLSTAFYLVNQGLRIAVIDERTIGGNSSLSAGIISYDNEQDLSVWVEDLGYDNAKKLVDIMRNSAIELVSLIERNKFDFRSQTCFNRRQALAVLLSLI
jgi:glycine/D-amino acid oxidase-like deaminating enzyme